MTSVGDSALWLRLGYLLGEAIRNGIDEADLQDIFLSWSQNWIASVGMSVKDCRISTCTDFDLAAANDVCCTCSEENFMLPGAPQASLQLARWIIPSRRRGRGLERGQGQAENVNQAILYATPLFRTKYNQLIETTFLRLISSTHWHHKRTFCTGAMPTSKCFVLGLQTKLEIVVRSNTRSVRLWFKKVQSAICPS